MTTACDQSKSSGTASGSLRPASAICWSVNARTRAQSVLPRFRSRRGTIVISFSFIFARTPHRDPSAAIFADRTRGGEDHAADDSEDRVSFFTAAIRSTHYDFVIKDLCHIQKIDFVLQCLRVSSHPIR